MKKTAIITGVTGQDGALLASFLLNKGYRVVGTSRNAQSASFSSLTALGVKQDVEIYTMSPTDYQSVVELTKRVAPDEIYSFSGQSSVGLSFEEPVQTLHSIAIGTLNILETIRHLGGGIKLYNASSGECFGDTKGIAVNENSVFSPRSPYAVAKATAFWASANYREAYGVFVSSGILFNHESSFRPPKFVTRKIVNSACRIAKGSNEILTLGDLSIRRDWGWAAEYVDAMWRILQLEKPEDFVIATGITHSLEEFVDEAFSCLGLNWQNHVVTDRKLFRPSDIPENKGNAMKAKEKLGWTATIHMKELVKKMVETEFNKN